MINKTKKYNYKKIFIFISILIIIIITLYILKKKINNYLFIELFNNENTNETNNIIKQESAVLFSHLGLGDNINNIGAVNFLSKYYNTINFLCKDIYVENVNLLFQDKIINKNIILIPVKSDNTIEYCRKIISDFMTNNSTDIFISGREYTPDLRSRISHPNLLKYVQNDLGYTIKWSHIHDFYYDIGLDLSIYYNYFNIDSTKESKEYFENIKKYKIIFLHTKASNHEILLNDVIDKYINNLEAILICANKNIYPIDHNHHELANKYVDILVPYYIDIIYNASEIHVIDSCFSCIVHPLNVTKKLAAHSVNIYER